MTTLCIEHGGSLATGDGRILCVGGEATWELVLHSNSANIRIAMPGGEKGQHDVLVLPRRAENLFSLLSDSVEEELELAFVLRGLPVDRAMLSRLASELGITPVLAARPEDLSGGQKVRLALAVLLLRKPSTLVLDNALEAIDEPSRVALASLLRREVDLGMRLVELTTSAPLDATVVDEVLIQEQDGWARARAVEARERILGWSASGLVAGVRQPPQERSALRVRELEFQFEAGFRLWAPALIVRAGEILWVVGPNGSGKTTLLKSLALLLRPHQGYLHFDRVQESLAINLAEGGRRIDPVHRFALYQFQDPDDQIYCESVHEELVATARQCHGIDNDLVRKYAEQLGLSARLQDSPWDLSRSARRLLTLGSVLCATPAVAMLDEPTVELDANQKVLIAGTLTDFAGSGGACVVVSHDSHFMEAICTTRIDVRGGHVGSGWS